MPFVVNGRRYKRGRCCLSHDPMPVGALHYVGNQAIWQGMMLMAAGKTPCPLFVFKWGYLYYEDGKLREVQYEASRKSG